MQLLVEGLTKYTKATEGLLVEDEVSDVDQVDIVDQVDLISDQIFDIILAVNDNNEAKVTEFQRILAEQLGKVIGAGMRMTWNQLRNSSGKLPNGRTVLGFVVDPLGIFSGSSLAEVDEDDRRVLNATSALITLVQNNLPSSSQDILKSLGPAELQEITRILFSKVWERRQQLQVTSTLLLSELLRQTSKRLEGRRVISPSAVKTESRPDILLKEKKVVEDSPRAAKARLLVSSTRELQ